MSATEIVVVVLAGCVLLPLALLFGLIGIAGVMALLQKWGSK